MPYLKKIKNVGFKNYLPFISVKQSKNEPEMLSLGALQDVYEGRNEDDIVVQVLGVKQLPGEEEKYRINISDGRNSTSLTVLDPAMNHLIWEREIARFAIIQTKVICQRVGEKRVLILQNIKVINQGWRVNGIYGSPKNTDYPEMENSCAMCKELHKCSE